MMRRFFHLDELGTNVRVELRAGLVTFMAMAYIIFVQPAMLARTGMDFGSVMMATCLASALATILMGLLANYPIALAPAMGTNAFFTYTVCLTMKVPWQQALGAVFLSGAIFLGLAAFGARERIMHMVPAGLKIAIAVGIGLLIALVGLEHCGIVVAHPATLVTLGSFNQPHVLLALGTLVAAAVLVSLRVRGALLIAILGATLAAWALGMVGLPEGQSIVSAPPSMAKTFFKLDILGALKSWEMLGVVFVFFFLDLFDTVGTLIGVGLQSDLMKDGKLPRARRALLSDAVGTVVGACFGTSTVTSYIESSTGVSEGGRSGLANMATAGCFLLAIFFSPVIAMVGGGVQVGEATFYPITGPILVLIGSFMLRTVTRIDFDDPTEYIPAFLTIVIMPLGFSITEGIAFGFISYALLKLATGRARQVHWMVYLFAALFVARYVLMIVLQENL